MSSLLLLTRVTIASHFVNTCFQPPLISFSPACSSNLSPRRISSTVVQSSMDFKLVHRSAIAGEDDDDEDGGGFSAAAAAHAEEAIREKGPSGSWSPVGASIVRRGWALGKRLAVAGAAVSSAPVVVPPVLLFSTFGLALSVPFGLYFAGLVCTEKLMSSLLPLPKEEELIQEWEQGAVEATAGEESAVSCQYILSLLPRGGEIVGGGEEDAMGKSDREEKLSDGEKEEHGCEDVAIGSPATEEARDNAGEEPTDGMPIGDSQAAEEEGEEESNAIADGHELQPIVVSMFMSEALEGNDESLKSREDSTVLDILNAAEASEEEAAEVGIGVNLVSDEIENNFVNSASEVDALVLDAVGVPETVEDYNLIEELRVADGWKQEEVGIDVLEENAPVLDTNDIAYTCEQDELIEELCAADTGREEELRDMSIDASALDVGMFDAEAQEEDIGIGMVENPVTGVPILDAEAIAETDEQIILMGELQLEEEWTKEEVTELALGDNAAAVEIEVSGGLPFELANDLKSEWLQVPDELTAAVVVIGENNGGIDEGVNVPECESANEEVEADRIEVSCRSSDAETDGFVEQLQATQFDVTETKNLEGETMDDQTLPGAINCDNLNSKDEAVAAVLLSSSSNERPNAVDHGAVGRNEEVVGDLPHEEGTGSEHKIKAAQETSAASAVEDRSPSGVADDREISLNTDPTVMVHNHQTSMPSDESWNAEEKLWQQVYALRTIMGCNAPLRSSLAEELKDLYLFTGIEMSSDPSMECSDNTVLQLNAQLQFLKSVIGVE